MSQDEIEKEDIIFTDHLIDEHLRNGELKWYHWVPLVNYFYETFFHGVPSDEGFERMMTLFALIDSLMLAVICSVPSAVTFDEIQAALGRWSNTNYTSWSYCTTPGNQIYNDPCEYIVNTGNNPYAASQEGYYKAAHWYIYGLSSYCTASLTFFSMSIACVIISYLSTANVCLLGYNHKGSIKVREAWWSVMKYLVCFTFVTTLLGIVFFYFAMHRLYFIKFPSRYIETEGRANEWTGGGPYGDSMHAFFLWALLGMFPVLIGAFICVSFALTQKNKEIVRQMKEECNF